MVADVDKWIDIARECKYLPENEMKVRVETNCNGDKTILITPTMPDFIACSMEYVLISIYLLISEIV